MKTCKNCGNTFLSSAAICPYCQARVGQSITEYSNFGSNKLNDYNKIKYSKLYSHDEINSNKPNNNYERANIDLKTAIKLFMIIDTILFSILIIPLFWLIPMTRYYFKKVDRGEYVSLGFKLCCIFFHSWIAGILMLCDPK